MYAVDDGADHGGNEREQSSASADAYETLPSGTRPDSHTYDSMVPAHRDKTSAAADGSTVTSGCNLSGRTIVVALVCVILSAVTSTIVVVVYHLTFANVESEASGNITLQIQELRSQLDTLSGKQTNSSHQLNILQDTSSHQLGVLELNQANIDKELDVLRQTQINASVHLETLTDGHTTTNRQIEILAEKHNKSGQQVAFSVYVIQPTSDPTTFYRTTINTGHFNISSGQFRCPVAGIYYFSFSFERNNKESGNAYCYFHVNGGGSVYVRAQSSPYEAASGSVIYHLSVNDIMSLYCTGLQFVSNGDNTVFSGFLISPDP